jgi:hypothetical protein
MYKKETWQDVNISLLNKDWEFYDSQFINDYKIKTITWSFKKYIDNENKEKANQWITLKVDDKQFMEFEYKIVSKKIYLNLLAELKILGFKNYSSDVLKGVLQTTYVLPGKYFIRTTILKNEDRSNEEPENVYYVEIEKIRSYWLRGVLYFNKEDYLNEKQKLESSTENLELEDHIIGNNSTSDSLNSENLLPAFELGQKYLNGIVAYLNETKKHGIIISDTIISTNKTWNEALSICKSYSINDKNWQLPTKSELELIFSNIEYFKFLETSDFWSSSEFGEMASYASIKANSQNYINKLNKLNKLNVIAIKRF